MGEPRIGFGGHYIHHTVSVVCISKIDNMALWRIITDIICVSACLANLAICIGIMSINTNIDEL